MQIFRALLGRVLLTFSVPGRVLTTSTHARAVGFGMWESVQDAINAPVGLSINRFVTTRTRKSLSLELLAYPGGSDVVSLLEGQPLRRIRRAVVDDPGADVVAGGVPAPRWGVHKNDIAGGRAADRGTQPDMGRHRRIPVMDEDGAVYR